VSGSGESERVAKVRAAVDAINRGDWETALAETAPDFQYDLSRTDSPLRGVYGRDDMPRVIEEFLGVWESARYEPREFVEAGDFLVVPFSTHFRGREGIEMTMEAVWVWTFRDEAAVRLALFQDAGEALAYAGAA
jgi:ketosteroid isomerase-like protein